MAGGISLLYCTLLHQPFAAVEASGSPVQLLISKQLFTLGCNHILFLPFLLSNPGVYRIQGYVTRLKK